MAAASPLRFTRVELRNWRNFRAVDVALGERAFLVGPNASGKSNFLGALRLLRDVAKPTGGLSAALESHGGVSAIRCCAKSLVPEWPEAAPSLKAAMLTLCAGSRHGELRDMARSGRIEKQVLGVWLSDFTREAWDRPVRR